MMDYENERSGYDGKLPDRYLLHFVPYYHTFFDPFHVVAIVCISVWPWAIPRLRTSLIDCPSFLCSGGPGACDIGQHLLGSPGRVAHSHPHTPVQHRKLTTILDGEPRDQYARDDRSMSPRRRESPPRRDRNRSASPGGRMGDRYVSCFLFLMHAVSDSISQCRC